MPGYVTQELSSQCPECLELHYTDIYCRVDTLLTERVGRVLHPGLFKLHAVTPDDHEIVASYRVDTGEVTVFWARPTPLEFIRIGTPYCFVPWRHQSHWPREVYELARR
jgi:hypothetical protein